MQASTGDGTVITLGMIHGTILVILGTTQVITLLGMVVGTLADGMEVGTDTTTGDGTEDIMIHGTEEAVGDIVEVIIRVMEDLLVADTQPMEEEAITTLAVLLQVDTNLVIEHLVLDLRDEALNMEELQDEVQAVIASRE